MTGRTRRWDAMVTGPADRGHRPLRSRIAWVILVLGVLGTLTAGYWGISAPRGDDDTQIEVLAAQGDVIDIPRGQMRVDSIVPEVLQHAMPGMSMPDPVPEGYERFGVSLTLRAATASGLAYSPDSFILTGEGMEPTGPLRSGGGSGEVPDGMQVSLTFVFQAPEDASSLRLSFRGASQAVLLEDAPQDEGDEGDHGH